MKLGTVIVLDTVSKPVDFGFSRSRVRDTGSASLRFFRTVAEPVDEQPLPLPIFVHADNVVRRRRFSFPQSARSFFPSSLYYFKLYSLVSLFIHSARLFALMFFCSASINQGCITVTF